MKTPQEVFDDYWGKNSMDKIYAYDVKIVIKQTQIEAYNQAIEDAAKNAKYRFIEDKDGKINIVIDEQSILRLKK